MKDSTAAEFENTSVQRLGLLRVEHGEVFILSVSLKSRERVAYEF